MINEEIAKIIHDYIERGIGCDYDIFNSPPPPIPIRPVKVKTLKERLEDNKMKATSVQNIKNVKDVCFSIENYPLERESKLTIVASTDDDIFAFEFEGSDLLQSCKRSGLFTGWEKDQKIRELEEKLNAWKKEASDCLKLRDETRREKNKEINELKQQLQQAENDKKRLTYKLQENEKLKEELVRENEKNIKRFDCLNRKFNRVMNENKLQEESSDQPSADNVNHPSHYTGRYECIDVMQDVFGNEATDNFCLCNAFKYIWRARKKNGLEDVKKAVWYLNKYIEEAEKDGVSKGE